ncbi:DUF3846 domain-containing protein [Microbacterium arborescens]|uniref:DUF3846 domain-containing protein n=1 Tax=Microbacterium arborescens TaxID=33883 RepID=UPI003C777673
MVKSIVIPYDGTRPPRLQEMADIGAFQEAVDGWLEIIEVPGMGVTMYVNEAAHRDFAPLNTRAMALRWLYSVEPMQHPLLFGDVVLSGLGDENEGDVPEAIVRELFDATTYFIDARSHAGRMWSETRAQFSNVFDAAVWCMLISRFTRPGVQIRVRSVVRSPA